MNELLPPIELLEAFSGSMVPWFRDEKYKRGGSIRNIYRNRNGLDYVKSNVTSRRKFLLENENLALRKIGRGKRYYT